MTSGILSRKNWRRLISFSIMLELYQVGLFIIVLAANGNVRPALLIPGIFVWAPVSTGSLLVPLILALVAILSIH